MSDARRDRVEKCIVKDRRNGRLSVHVLDAGGKMQYRTVGDLETARAVRDKLLAEREAAHAAAAEDSQTGAVSPELMARRTQVLCSAWRV